MRCLICDSNDWENVDQFRLKPEGMSICKSCGFVSYPSKWKSEEEIKKYYKDDYRKAPHVGNLYTGQRKLFFHKVFLNDLFTEWKKQGKETPKIFEVGAAYGMALDSFRRVFPKADIGGTELTKTYKRVAFHEYGIKLQDDFDDSKKYDLIMSYKVAEHQLDIDKYLRKYVEHLTDDGFMYISVPIWFQQMNLFGQAGFSIEEYYHPNHINMWTRKHFEYLLKKVGLEIVKEDHHIYDSTYLCKRNDSLMSSPVHKESVEEIKSTMDKIKRAGILFSENRLREAIDIYPNFPPAYHGVYEFNRKEYHEQGFDWVVEHFIDPALKSCLGSPDILCLAMDIAMRFGKFEEAIKYGEESLVKKPENPMVLERMMFIMREMAIVFGKQNNKQAEAHYYGEAVKIAKHTREICAELFGQMTSDIYKFESLLEIPEQ